MTSYGTIPKQMQSIFDRKYSKITQKVTIANIEAKCSENFKKASSKDF